MRKKIISVGILAGCTLLLSIQNIGTNFSLSDSCTVSVNEGDITTASASSEAFFSSDEVQTDSPAAHEYTQLNDDLISIDNEAVSLTNYSEPVAEPYEEEGSYPEYEKKLAIAQVNNYVNVRSDASTDSEILGKIYNGAVAEILGETEGVDGLWFHITSGSVEGYIKAEYFIYGEEASESLEQYVTQYVTVAVDKLNVRSEQDSSSKKIGYFVLGEKAKLLENCGDWIKVAFSPSTTGYVSSEYVTIVEEYLYAKSIDEEKAELAALEEIARREAEFSVPSASSLDTQTQDSAPSFDTAVADTSYTTNSELRSSIVEYAMQYLGNRYVHGGQSLSSGTDCSGFTCYLYAEYGYSLSRTPSGQLSNAGRSITMEEAQPGDIICYSSNGGKSCTHVALYIGDNQIIHAANSRKGVIISDVYYSTIVGVKNVID